MKSESSASVSSNKLGVKLVYRVSKGSLSSHRVTGLGVEMVDSRSRWTAGYREWFSKFNKFNTLSP